MIIPLEMVILKKNYTNNKSKLLFLTKILTILVISWLCLNYNDEYSISKSLECGSKIDISLDTKTHRSLAKQEKRNELMNPRIKYQTNDNLEKHILANDRESNNTYKQLKQGTPNHIEVYLKTFNQRYSRKKGIKKLDCYYEKKLFNSIDKIEKYVKHKNINKKHIKKMLYKKYGIPLFILSLMPLFGLILPMMIDDRHHITRKCGISITYFERNGKVERQSWSLLHNKCHILPREYIYLNYIFVFSLILIIILLIFYLFIKVTKYERIKHGY